MFPLTFLFSIARCQYLFLFIFSIYFYLFLFYFMSHSSHVYLFCFIQMPSLLFVVICCNFYHEFQLTFSYYFSMTIFFMKCDFIGGSSIHYCLYNFMDCPFFYTRVAYIFFTRVTHFYQETWK